MQASNFRISKPFQANGYIIILKGYKGYLKNFFWIIVIVMYN